MADPVVGITNGVPTSGTGTITTLGQTLLDGANATHGAIADAAVAAGAAGSISAKLRSISRDVAGGVVLQAGTNVIGHVIVDTAPSTAVTNAGTFAVQVSNANANGRATPANSAPVVLNSMTYKAVAASATATLFGATGASGDYLDGVLIVPATAAAGAVSITDGSGSAITIFAGGGTTALPTLAPFYVPIGAISSGGAGGWKVTTGTNVSVIGVGNFT